MGLAAIQEVREMAKQTDPVCWMQIEESDAAGTSEHHGRTHYFCSTQCKEKFDENPDNYAKQS
jgi:YHS domain-containing protein